LLATAGVQETSGSAANVSLVVLEITILEQYCNPKAPTVQAARKLARDFRHTVAPPSKAIDLQRCCRALNVSVSQARLRETDGQGYEALLVPMSEDRFEIVLDDSFGGQSEGATLRHRRRFRIAHELAHVTFYTRGAGRPRRALPTGTGAEEDFCDEFARTLLVPTSPAHVDAQAVVDTQREYDVSIEVAARAVAASAGARVALWWWMECEDGGPARVREQWTNSRDLVADLGIHPFKTDVNALANSFRTAHTRAPSVTTRFLPERRQAVAVKPRD